MIFYFDELMEEWAIKHNPNDNTLISIYPIPGQPGGGYNKACYYEARNSYMLWSTETEYGRMRHKMLDDLIQMTEGE